MVFTQTTLEFSYDTGEHWLVRFDKCGVTWECRTPDGINDTGTRPYHATEVAQSTILIAWTDQGGELVLLIVNLERRVVHASHIFGAERFFLEGELVQWTAS